MNFLAGIILSAALVFGYQNPVVTGFYPDPSVCRVGEDYYMVHSSFQYFPGVPLLHSKDLIHWEHMGNVLTRDSQLMLKDANSWSGIYAPTIRYNNGRFYMVTTNVSDKGNFFVWTDDINGEWSDPVWLEQGGIDPSFYFEGDDCWMVSNPEDGIKLCKIDIETGKTLVPSKEIWKGDGGRYPEAPHIYKKDGWYYLMIAEGGTEFGHSETIARSRNIDGPYESNPANPILTNFRQRTQGCEIQGCGHADMVQAPDGSWWVVCLGFRIQNGNHHLLGRETFLAPVEWPAGGWPVVNGNGSILSDMQVPTLPQMYPDGKPVTEVALDAASGASVSEGEKNLLASGKFGPQWMWLNNPDYSLYTWTEDKHLVIKGTDTSIDVPDAPSFVAHRQTSQEFSLTSTVKVGEHKKGNRAGLTVFMGFYAHADIYVTRGLFFQKVVMEYRGLGMDHIEKKVCLFPGKVTLKVSADKNGYTFEYSRGDKGFEKLGWLDCRFLSTETVNGFTGIVLGMFAEKGTAEFCDYTYII